MSPIHWPVVARAFYGRLICSGSERGPSIDLYRGKLLCFFDNRKILLISRSLFAIGSALAAAAPTMNAFIVGKAITGFGGSGTYISVINIITALTSAEEQGQYFGYIGFMWGLGTMSVSAFASSFFVAKQELELDPLLEAPSLPHRQVGVGVTTSTCFSLVSLFPSSCMSYLLGRHLNPLQDSGHVLVASTSSALCCSLALFARGSWLYYLVERCFPGRMEASLDYSAAQELSGLRSASSRPHQPSRRKKIAFSPSMFYAQEKCGTSSFKPAALSVSSSSPSTTFRCIFNSYEGNRRFDRQSIYSHFFLPRSLRCWYQDG